MSKVVEMKFYSTNAIFNQLEMKVESIATKKLTNSAQLNQHSCSLNHIAV